MQRKQHQEQRSTDPDQVTLGSSHRLSTLQKATVADVALQQDPPTRGSTTDAQACLLPVPSVFQQALEKPARPSKCLARDAPLDWLATRDAHNSSLVSVDARFGEIPSSVRPC
jgi:hypothetical protein